MKDDNFPVMGGGYKPPPPVEPPKPLECAIFHSGSSWAVWRVNGTYMLFQRRPFKVRPAAGLAPVRLHYDYIAVCPVDHHEAAACGIDSDLLTEAREACHFHHKGLS